jgi:hypothetical protein
MSYLIKNREPVWQEKPSDVTSADVCLTGFPPSEDTEESCAQKTKDFYWENGLPSVAKVYRKEYWVHADTGLPYKSGEPTENLKLESHAFYADPVTPDYCADCARPIDDKGQTVYESYTVDESNSSNGLDSLEFVTTP